MKFQTYNAMAAFLFLALTTGCSDTYKGEGPAVEQRREVGKINRVALNMDAVVFIRDTSESFCVVRAQENIQEAIITRMDGGTLVVGTKGNVSTSEPIVIEIGMVRPEGIEVNGSGSVTSRNTLKNDQLDLEVNGSGKLTVELVAVKLKTYVSGSGTVRLNGSAQHHRIEVSGSGIVEANRFSTLTTGADISGSGEAHVAAEEQLDVQVTGSGSVLYTGDPKVNKRITGSGTVSKSN